MKNMLNEKKNYLITICASWAIVVTCALLCFTAWNNSQREGMKQPANENITTLAVVKDMYTAEPTNGWLPGAACYITAEHEIMAPNGEKTVFTQSYKIPWQDYAQIKVGDSVLTKCVYAPADGAVGMYISLANEDI